jgi:hypothetical protein
MTVEIIFALRDLLVEEGYKATVMGPRTITPFMLVSANYETIMVGIEDGQLFIQLDLDCEMNNKRRVFFDLADPDSISKLIDGVPASIAHKIFERDSQWSH